MLLSMSFNSVHGYLSDLLLLELQHDSFAEEVLNYLQKCNKIEETDLPIQRGLKIKGPGILRTRC